MCMCTRSAADGGQPEAVMLLLAVAQIQTPQVSNCSSCSSPYSSQKQ
jgi:hypothetical protein